VTFTAGVLWMLQCRRRVGYWVSAATTRLVGAGIAAAAASDRRHHQPR